MRNPVLSLLSGLAVAVIGFGASLWISDTYDVGLRFGQTSPTVLLPGLVVGAIGLWLMLRTYLLVRLRDALLRGEGAIARWQVAAAEWEHWRAHDSARSALWDTLRNKLAPSAAPAPMEGVPIVIGPRALVVGRSIVPLNITGFSPYAIWQLGDVSIAEAPPGSLEFSSYIRGKQTRIDLVRIPLGAGGRPQAAKVRDHFLGAVPERHRNFAREVFSTHFQAMAGDVAGANLAWRRSLPGRFAWLAGIFGAVGIGLWLNIKYSRDQPPPPDWLDPVGAAGAVLLVLAIVFGLVDHFRSRQ